MKKFFVSVFIILCMPVARAYSGEGDPAQGKEKYATLCASCHGASGKGDGPAAAALTPKPRDFTNCDVMKAVSDDEMFEITKSGGVAVGKSPLMPPWGSSLNDQDIANVVAYLRSLCQK